MVGGSEGFSPRPSQTDDKCKQIVGESPDEKETLFAVVGRKELSRELQEEQRGAFEMQTIESEIFSREHEHTPSRSTLIAHRFSSLSSLLCFYC